jgi:hypothetical protein
VRKMIAEEQGIGHLSNERLRKSLSVLVGFYIAPGLGSVWNAWRGTANVRARSSATGNARHDGDDGCYRVCYR